MKNLLETDNTIYIYEEEYKKLTPENQLKAFQELIAKNKEIKFYQTPLLNVSNLNQVLKSFQKDPELTKILLLRYKFSEEAIDQIFKGFETYHLSLKVLCNTNSILVWDEDSFNSRFEFTADRVVRTQNRSMFLKKQTFKELFLKYVKCMKDGYSIFRESYYIPFHDYVDISVNHNKQILEIGCQTLTCKDLYSIAYKLGYVDEVGFPST